MPAPNSVVVLWLGIFLEIFCNGVISSDKAKSSMYRFRQNFQFPHSTASFQTKSEQNNIQSEKPSIHDHGPTGIFRFVSKHWHLF